MMPTAADQIRSLTSIVEAHEKAAGEARDAKTRNMHLREALVFATIAQKIEREEAVRQEFARIRADGGDPMHDAFEKAVTLLQGTVAGDDQGAGGTQ